ncbi:TetR/AcrR family transcriptional regulator [Vibrio sp. 10N.261.55.A7]|uniref:TetR/AcrR family transcriptional regulator n=1 Tax=Vibrio sp. 10N.261.55.A7 TaxID=1880851 RepID=UPI000C839159|nr:TetR/AcrR family transcriptional regulator [Vibrio sp. 10N.261.55.A7]PMJ99537.1 hypothetical protein BCU12_03620 [Vibrio sp. 10N.261.55.A7]
MGRASVAEAELTKQKIIDAAFKITLEQGFNQLTFSNLSDHCGVSRSGINRHFPKKADLIQVLKLKLNRVLMKHLDFTSTDAFYHSWVNGLSNNKEFKSAILAAAPIIPTREGVSNLKHLIQGAEEEVLKCIYVCIGYAIVNLR